MSKSKSNSVGISLRQVSEGQLLKYTNMMKGWQPRWFILDPHSGLLEYFMSEGEKKHRPRASLHLAGAIIVPSEEDSYTFSVNAANEDSFKLRAVDARERQYWVNRLRVVAQAHTQVLAESNPPLFRDHPQLSSTLSTTSAVSVSSPFSLAAPPQKMLSCNLTVLDAFSSVRDYLRRVECEHQRLIHDIENLPSSGPVTTSTDTEVLLLKATSQATLLCLEQCLAILHYQQQQPNKPNKANSASSSPLLGYPKKPAPPANLPDCSIGTKSEGVVSALRYQTFSGTNAQWSTTVGNVAENLDEESEYVADEPISVAAQETGSDEYKSLTLKLLSQFKLGTELTRTTLPVFFCECRSLLQVIADAFRQPHLLSKLAQESNAELRMAKVVQWYVGCIRASQLDMTAARKPFNPILGETFKCIWNVSDEESGDTLVYRFLAEQVSHNPPVSAFSLECAQKPIKLEGTLSVKAKFMGMYVGVTLGGDLFLELPSGRYEMNYPTLYLRSFLTEPWMEFGGKININCVESKTTAGVVFQTKPFYGGKPHQVSAEIKAANGNTTLRLSGDWMAGALEMSWMSGQTESLEAQTDWLDKKIRPVVYQTNDESHCVWAPVRQPLSSGDFKSAADAKKMIEERQREKERVQSEQGGLHRGKLFKRDKEVWKRV